MKVTIITVCLNSEKTLPDCIQSVRNQSYQDIEYILVDGRSTDATISIINKNLDFISHFISEPDRGMYDAINKGLKLASGDIVGILNSDDVFAGNDAVEKIVKCFKEHGTDAVYGDLVYTDAATPDKIVRYWKSKPYKRAHFLWGWMPAHPTFYIRRDLIMKYGYYENHFYTAADYEFMARYLFKHKCSATYLEEILVNMHTGGLSNGNLKRRLRANRRDYLAMKRNKIPFAFIVSILKPLSKLHQYKNSLLAQASRTLTRKPAIKYLELEQGSRRLENVEVLT
ncbi:MAG TPA: glycosyltransferase family 2 protein [Ginsengibacter sp.]|nr:glycosyltransferase [Chitinophagaceae bacterium]HRN73993.1 glycosyltransferase family 2 protein [Ginsengibacter sp.]